jgi:hypothetical protein
MNLMQNDIERAISSYLNSFSWYEPSNKKSPEYVAHYLVSQLINAHLLDVQFDSELREPVKEFEKFVRQIQGELDCIYFDISDFPASSFLKKLSALKPSPVLQDYHNLVVKLLKIILLRISESSNPKIAQKKVTTSLLSIIQTYAPAAVVVPRFNDKEQQSEKELFEEEQLEVLLQNFLDITV